MDSPAFVNPYPCSRCSSVSVPLLANHECHHKFCVRCFLYLWSLQNPGEPCECPNDGKKIAFIRPAYPRPEPEPEDMTALLAIYNPLFIQRAREGKGGFIQMIYVLHFYYFIAGVYAYTLAAPRS